MTVNNSAIALANAGKHPESVAASKSGASAFPASAATLYAQAAFVMATDKTPDWKKVKAEADKALAVDPTDGRANFVLGIAAASKNDLKSAKDYLNKAKQPGIIHERPFAKQVDARLKTA